MKLTFCVACGDIDGLEHHHLVPRAHGGSDNESNLVTLCSSCHGLAHGMIRKNISQLTKSGLKAAKARGVALGGDRGGKGSDEGRKAAGEAVRRLADDRAADVMVTIEEMRAEGVKTLARLAQGLIERGVLKARGGVSWTATDVRNIIARTEAPTR